MGGYYDPAVWAAHQRAAVDCMIFTCPRCNALEDAPCTNMSPNPGVHGSRNAHPHEARVQVELRRLRLADRAEAALTDIRASLAIAAELVVAVPACRDETGTVAGWMRHRRVPEDPCRVCKDAHNAYERDRRARGRTALTLTDRRPLDLGPPFDTLEVEGPDGVFTDTPVWTAAQITFALTPKEPA